MLALVTGSNGLIGGQLVRLLLRNKEWEVHCAARRELNIPGVSVHNIDLTDFEAVAELFQNYEFDVVFNCAAVVKVGRGESDDMVGINCDIVHFIVEAMMAQRKRGLLVHLSSIAAMGVDNIAKCSSYGRSKFLSENEVWRAQSMGLNVVVMRPSVVVGIGGQMERVLRYVKRWGMFYPSGSSGFVDVNDVARVMEMVAMDDKYWNRAWCVNGWNLKFKDFINTFGGRALVRLPKWVGGAMLSKERQYDGSELGFHYTSLEDCSHRIKEELR